MHAHQAAAYHLDFPQGHNIADPGQQPEQFVLLALLALSLVEGSLAEGSVAERIVPFRLCRSGRLLRRPIPLVVAGLQTGAFSFSRSGDFTSPSYLRFASLQFHSRVART